MTYERHARPVRAHQAHAGAQEHHVTRAQVIDNIRRINTPRTPSPSPCSRGWHMITIPSAGFQEPVPKRTFENFFSRFSLSSSFYYYLLLLLYILTDRKSENRENRGVHRTRYQAFTNSHFFLIL